MLMQAARACAHALGPSTLTKEAVSSAEWSLGDLDQSRGSSQRRAFVSRMDCVLRTGHRAHP